MIPSKARHDLQLRDWFGASPDFLPRLRAVEHCGGELPSAGSYWKDQRDGEWYAVTPDGQYGGLGNHDVTEHEDGTITVSPSILVSGHDGSWHGYLERGVWRSC